MTTKKKSTKKSKTSTKKSTKKYKKQMPVVDMNSGKQFLTLGELNRINQVAFQLENSKLKMSLKEQHINNIKLKIKILAKYEIPEIKNDLEFKKKKFELTSENKRLYQLEYQLTEKEVQSKQQEVEILEKVELRDAMQVLQIENKNYAQTSLEYNNLLSELRSSYDIKNHFGYSPMTGEIQDVE